MSSKQPKNGLLILAICLVIIAIIVALVAFNGGFERTEGFTTQTEVSDAVNQPADTSVSDSISFGDFTATELSGGVDLDETSCAVRVVITNPTDSDALIAITLDFDSGLSVEETAVPTHTRWEVTFIREAPIVALTLTEATGLSDVNLNFAPDYSRCNGEPATNAGGGVGDSQTVERLDQTTPPTTAAVV